MLEKYTVDVIAQDVADRLLEGEPTPRLAHRFFRKGRRDGKHAFSCDTIQGLLTDAVSLAGSSLSESYLETHRDLTAKVSELGHLVASAESAVDPRGDRPETDLSVDTGHGDDPLAFALKARRRLMAQAERRHDQLAAEAAWDGQQDAARAARDQLPALTTRLERLEGEYHQRFESIAHSGQLLWSRYCNGYEQGRVRRGSRESDVRVPRDALAFVAPSALGSRRPVTAQTAATSTLQGE